MDDRDENPHANDGLDAIVSGRFLMKDVLADDAAHPGPMQHDVQQDIDCKHTDDPELKASPVFGRAAPESQVFIRPSWWKQKVENDCHPQQYEKHDEQRGVDPEVHQRLGQPSALRLLSDGRGLVRTAIDP